MITMNQAQIFRFKTEYTSFVEYMQYIVIFMHFSSDDQEYMRVCL